MARTTKPSATKRRPSFGRMVAYTVAACAMIPAIVVNVDASGSAGAGWTAYAAGSIILAAGAIEAARLVGRFWAGLALWLFAAFAIIQNVNNAMENAAHKSDHRSDHRRGAIIAAENASSQRSQWSQGRKEQAEIAGEAAVASIEADIQRTIAKDAKRWTATSECDPLKTTAKDSMAFCSEIAELKRKLGAAKKRDELDARIVALDASQVAAGRAPTSADPYVDNVAAILEAFGVKLTKDGRDRIGATRNLMKSLGLELMATFGPTIILIIFEKAGTPRREIEIPSEKPKATAPAPHNETQKEAAPSVAAQEPQALAAEDPIHAFVAARIDRHEGATMPAGEPWRLWLEYCTEKGIPAGSQKAFGGKLKQLIAWEQNNNRPRYLNIRAKPAAPALRVVASNG